MKLGIWTPLPHTIRSEPAMEAAIQNAGRRGGDPNADAGLDFATQVVCKAEQYGFAITLVAERYLGPDLEAWMLAAALAARTKTIQIMPAIHPGMVTPQVVAKMGATLDRISGGRCAVNVVNGWWKDEFELFGNGAWLDDESERYKRMEEFVRVLRGMWTEDGFSFGGKYYNVEGADLPTKPQQVPCPPIYAASRSDAGKDVIAKYCDTWFLSYGSDPAQFEANIDGMARDIEDMRRRSAACKRQVKCGISAHVVCADTQEEAQARVDDLVAYGKLGRIPFIAVNGLGAGLFGTPEVIAERMRRLDSIGIDVVMLKFSPMLAQLDKFGSEVLPLLRDVSGEFRKIA